MMKKSVVFLLVGAIAAGAMCVGCGGSNGGKKIQIVVDGGGIAGNYNSSISMTPSPANPNPYNQLELLAKEWSEQNDKYEIKINRNSMNGNRDAILGYVSTSSGPDIIFQTGTTIAEDMEKNYFVDMTDYLDQPNKYAEGNEKWADLYDPQELEASRAPNGSFYSIGIDRNVAGIMYNEKILKAAGVELPINTYGDFVKAQTKIQTYSDSNSLEIIPYAMVDNWYDIVLESGLYGCKIDEYDVINKNGVINAEEICRASTLGDYKIMNGTTLDPRYEAYLNILKKSQEYTPAGTKGNTAVTEFMKGNVAMVSCLGKSMVQVQLQNKVEELGVMGYPVLTQADVDTYGGVKGVTIDAEGVRRGISGIGTGWWITNSAMKKQTVEACVDFLQYVTAPQNNVKMVNKLGYALPLDTELAATEGLNPLFDDVIAQYNEDVKNGFYEFHVFNSWGILGFDYWSTFVVQSTNLYNGAEPKEVAQAINSQFLSSRDTLIEKNGTSGAWDVDGWESLS